VKFGIKFAGELNAGAFGIVRKGVPLPSRTGGSDGRAKPAGQGVSATAETAGKPGDLEAEEKDAADIM
jgi:hypothetical protein